MFKSLQASFHSSLFAEVDLLSDPVDTYFVNRREYPFPFTEFFTADTPDKILCTPPYTEMVLKAEITGVLTANELKLREYLYLSLEKLFEHVLFSFLLVKQRSSGEGGYAEAHLTYLHKMYGSEKVGKNSTFHDISVSSLTGDRCAELLLLPPEPLPKNSFSFIASDSSSMSGVERVIYYSSGDLKNTQEIARLGVNNLRKSLLRQYHHMRSSGKPKDDVIHVASLIKELAFLIKKGELHVSDGGDLYLPTKATVDHRCVLWLPRSSESWVYTSDDKSNLKVEDCLEEKNSIIVDHQGDVLEAYDYGDQIEMLDIIPLQSLENRVADGPSVMQSADALQRYLCIKKCMLAEISAMQTKTWNMINRFAEFSDVLSCKQSTYRTSSGHVGNFCFSGPPNAKLRILLTKFHGSNYFTSGNSLTNVEAIQTQFVSDLNSSTMENIGYDFEKMYSSAKCVDNRSSENLNMSLFRRKGACNIAMPCSLRQNITDTWISGVKSMARSASPTGCGESRLGDLIDRLKSLEVICPCGMGKRPTN